MRVKTGKWTMFYMALSLSFTAGGIVLLYLLWNVKPVEGQTLNAVTFNAIIESLGWHSPSLESGILWLVLALEGGLLFVAANTGFLGGPAVLANMAADSWVPHQYRYLTTRLVTQRGLLLMGFCALGILALTRGSVAVLVVLYSINVFLTFSLSLVGLCFTGGAITEMAAPHRAFLAWSHRDVQHFAGHAGGEIHRGRLDDPADHRRGDRVLHHQSGPP